MLLIHKSKGMGCGCSHGLSALLFGGRRRSRGLGDSFSDAAYLACGGPTSTPEACDNWMTNGTVPTPSQLTRPPNIDAVTWNALISGGANSAQLMLVANGTMGPAVLQSQLDTVNQDVGSSNYPLAGGTPAPSTGFCSEDSLGLGLNNCTYLLIGGGGILALMLLRKVF
jgi:hypothetical protein